MVSATEIITKFQGEGWSLSQEAIEDWINDSGGSLTMHQAQQEILNTDIKEIGAPCLPSEIHKANSINGPLVVQVSKVRNLSAPKAFQESGGAPRMLGVTFTDGTNFCTGIEMQNIKAISLKLAPGTKVKLNGKININNGFLFLTPNNISVIGGMVEELYSKWKLALSVGKYSVRSAHVLGGSGPPPWVPFGKGINKVYEELNKFKALKDPQVKTEEEDKFEMERKQTVQELAKDGTIKVFGGGKQMLDANLQKVVNAGFNPEVASWALSNNKNNPTKAIQELKAAQNPSQAVNRVRDEDEEESFGRGGRGRGRGRGKSRNKVEGPDGSDDELPPPNMPRPSGPASLFDFLDTKMISKNEKVKFVEPVPEVTGPSSRGRGRGERGRGRGERDNGRGGRGSRGGRGNYRDRDRYNTHSATNSAPAPNLLTENWPAPGEDKNPVKSDRGYFESKEMFEELERIEQHPHHKSSENRGRGPAHAENRQHNEQPSRNTGSVGRDNHRDSHSEFRKDLSAGSFETNYDGVAKNSSQTTTQKSYHTNQNDSYRNSGGRGRGNYHNGNEKEQNRISGSQRGGHNYGHGNDYNSGSRDNYQTNQNDSYRNNRGRGQRNYDNSNEKEINKVSGSQRGGNNYGGQWNDYGAGSRANYNNDGRDGYYNSQKTSSQGAQKEQIRNDGGKYVEKSYPQRGENVARGGGGNSRQQRGGRGNGGYGDYQYYDDYSEKYSNYSAEPSNMKSQNHKGNMQSDGMRYNNSAGSDYSSPRYQQSRGAANFRGNGNTRGNNTRGKTDKQMDLIQQFQQQMLDQGHYTPEDVSAVNTKLLYKKK